jgi:Mg-chelatase subunit ChlD
MNSNNLELNQGDDFIIAIDVSGSMANTDCPGGLSRFQFALEKTKLFAHEAATRRSFMVRLPTLTFASSVARQLRLDWRS